MGDLLSPQDRVRQNQAVVASVAKLVQDNFIVRVQGRGYLMVQGAQAIGTAMGYTTAIESMRHVPAGDDGIAGYWEAIATVMADGKIVGRGMGCVFDDEKPWCNRPQFARQMMAQTRATGRALKGVMGWATALLGAEGSFAEEMPQEATESRQEAPAPIKRLPAPSKGADAPKGDSGALREVRGVCAGVEQKVSKAGKPYWVVTLEGHDGRDDVDYTSFEPLADMAGRMVMVKLKPYKDGHIVADLIDMEVDHG
jgi:hypothetical protein